MRNMKTSTIVSLQQPESAVVYTATVLSVSGNECQIDLSGTEYTARIVFSCLVSPIKDDTVLCVLSSDGQYYVTAVAEREGSQSITVSFPQDVTMQTPSGSMKFLSSESVTIAASESLNCLSDQVTHHSNTAFVNYDQATASGSELKASFSAIQVFSDLISTFSKQMLQKFKTYIRQSEQNDQVKAGNMTRQIKGLYTMDSELTVMISKKDTKIDAERIHLG